MYANMLVISFHYSCISWSQMSYCSFARAKLATITLANFYMPHFLPHHVTLVTVFALAPIRVILFLHVAKEVGL